MDVGKRELKIKIIVLKLFIEVWDYINNYVAY